MKCLSGEEAKMCWEKPWISLCSEYKREDSIECSLGVGKFSGLNGEIFSLNGLGLGEGLEDSSRRNF